MARSRSAAIGAVAVAGALVLAGCGSRPTDAAAPSGTAAPTAAAFNACMVLDTGGVDDRSFNQSSYAGLQAAAKANPNIKISYVPSNTANDYTPNLQAQANKKCNTTIAVGGLMADNVKAVAAANPSLSFAEVDSSSGASNVYGMQFNTAQGGFLGGYLAAGMTQTGKVATWGGLPIPPVTIYMDGFYEGVQYYNQQKGKTVQVLGWDENNQKGGTFSGSFTDQNKGLQISQTLIQQGADIIFPVAGGAGLGAGAAAQQAGAGKVNLIWVDTDGCESASQYCQFFISSVTKNLAGAVQEYVTKAAGGTVPTGSYVGTLANDGTGLAPFNQFDSKVPADLKAEIEKAKADIASGAITIKSPSQPAS